MISGQVPVGAEDRQRLSPQELAAGWRLACQACAQGDLRIELAQWEASILADNSPFTFTPRQGLGLAVDLGTTTVVAQLLDLESADVLGVRTALNEQAKHGADIMSRIEFAVSEKGASLLKSLIRQQIGRMVEDLYASVVAAGGRAGSKRVPGRLESVVVAGNTVMHHLFGGIDPEPLSHYPFEPRTLELQTFRASDLNWRLVDDPVVQFLPCLGGFVGSDILAGILATRMHESDALTALVDLGTNGEIVVGNRQRLLCTSTAAGPAFEGARISMGMRAATGAISEVHVADGELRCHVLGNTAPRGICGSGLVDAAASALQLGRLRPNGRLTEGDSLPLMPPVSIHQGDIRELQLAKGAIAAGLTILLRQWGAAREDLTRIHLAGAFGNYINQASARRIGLLDFPAERVTPAGNTALLGAKLALFQPDAPASYHPILSLCRHVSLKEDPGFQEAYVEAMAFPSG